MKKSLHNIVSFQETTSRMMELTEAPKGYNSVHGLKTSDELPSDFNCAIEDQIDATKKSLAKMTPTSDADKAALEKATADLEQGKEVICIWQKISALWIIQIGWWWQNMKWMSWPTTRMMKKGCIGLVRSNTARKERQQQTIWLGSTPEEKEPLGQLTCSQDHHPPRQGHLVLVTHAVNMAIWQGTVPKHSDRILLIVVSQLMCVGAKANRYLGSLQPVTKQVQMFLLTVEQRVTKVWGLTILGQSSYSIVSYKVLIVLANRII